MIYAANGATLHVCATPQTTEPEGAAAYVALTWVKIGELENIGQLGDTSEEIAFTGIEDNRTRRLKGARNAGTLEVMFGRDYADTGQTTLLAAEAAGGALGDYAFKVTFNDAPSGGTPSVRFFLAAVGAANEVLDTANSVIKLNASLWINTKITRVNAAEA